MCFTSFDVACWTSFDVTAVLKRFSIGTHRWDGSKVNEATHGRTAVALEWRACPRGCPRNAMSNARPDEQDWNSGVIYTI